MQLRFRAFGVTSTERARARYETTSRGSRTSRFPVAETPGSARADHTKERLVTPEELFYGFPEPVPATCWRLRDLVLEEAPDAVEGVRPRWKLLGFNLNKYFCAVAPQLDHARLLFEYGIELDDPAGELLGSGTQVRYLRFDSPDAIDEERVRRFLRLAIAQQAKAGS